jgi:alpha-1,3-rhamnosyltransferase
MNKENLLVSVCILTYNSSKFILETLESVGCQTYRHIELIICDDASTDDSVKICREWIVRNQDKLVRAELFVNEENRGIAPTRNFVVKQTQGEWIKFLDSDDFLTPHAIESYMKVISDETHFVAGNYIPFDEKGEKEVEKNRVTLPALIMKKDTFWKLGGFDERFPMLEDMPFFAKASECGYKFDFVNETVVYYRSHSGSIQLSDKFRRSHVNLVRLVLVPQYKKEKRYIDYWHDKLWSKKEIFRLDNQNVKSTLVYLLMLFSDGKEWYYIVRDKIWRPVIFKWRALRK